MKIQFLGFLPMIIFTCYAVGSIINEGVDCEEGFWLTCFTGFVAILALSLFIGVLFGGALWGLSAFHD